MIPRGAGSLSTSSSQRHYVLHVVLVFGSAESQPISGGLASQIPDGSLFGEEPCRWPGHRYAVGPAAGRRAPTTTPRLKFHSKKSLFKFSSQWSNDVGFLLREVSAPRILFTVGRHSNLSMTGNRSLELSVHYQGFSF